MISFSLQFYSEVCNSSLSCFSLLVSCRYNRRLHSNATQAAAQQAEIQNQVEAETTKRAVGLVENEKEKRKQKSAQDTNATKQDADDTTSQGSAGGQLQGA